VSTTVLRTGQEAGKQIVEKEQEQGYHETLTRITKMWRGNNQYELRNNLRDLENEAELAWRWWRSKP